MTLTINTETCVRCGACAKECPADAIVHDCETYEIRQTFCIRCSHCGLVCPVDAVETDRGPLPAWENPELSSEGVRSFLVGKRSIRIYRSDPLPREVVDDILAVGSLTASASNAQSWRAVVLTGRAVGETGSRIMQFYDAVLRSAENPLGRMVLHCTAARRFLKRRAHYRERIRDYFSGRDSLFFHAPAVVFLTYPKRRGHFGMTDCVLAGQAMMYYAQSLGLGSCMIGFAQMAVNRRKALRRSLGMRPDRRVGLVFTLGYTGQSYRKLPHRKELPATYMETLTP